VAFAAGARLSVGAASGAYTRIAAGDVSLAGALSVEVDAAKTGRLAVLTKTGGGTFTAADLAKVSVSSADGAALAASLSDDGKSICVELGGSSWPEGWNDGRAASAEMQDAFNAWSSVAGNDAAAENAEGAFLQGVDAGSYVELSVTGIARGADGRVRITTNADLSKVNGRLYALVGASLASPQEQWRKVPVQPDADDPSSVAIDAGEDARFFRIGVAYSIEDAADGE